MSVALQLAAADEIATIIIIVTWLRWSAGMAPVRSVRAQRRVRPRRRSGRLMAAGCSGPVAVLLSGFCLARLPRMRIHLSTTRQRANSASRPWRGASARHPAPRGPPVVTF